MATTAVFAEILIVGLEAAAWLGLLVLGALGKNGVDVHGLKGWDAEVTIVGVAAAYALGILVDRGSDSLLDWLDKRRVGRWANCMLERRKPDELSAWADTKPSVRKMRFAVMHEDSGIPKFLEYQRSRLRIARASFLNLLAATPFGLLYLCRRTDIPWGAELAYGLLAVTLGLALTNEPVEAAPGA